MEKLKTSHVDTRSRLPKFFVEHVANICKQAGLRMNRLELLNYSSSSGSQLWYVACDRNVLGVPCHYTVQFNSVGAFDSLLGHSDAEFRRDFGSRVVIVG